MVRITVIGLRGIPDVMGGIETHCSQLLPSMLRQLSRDQLEITVLARNRYVGPRCEYSGVLQIPIWAPRRASLETIVHTFLALLYARFFLKTDIVHLHAIGPGLLAPFARIMGFRLLFTHHGEDYRRQKWGAFSKTMLRLGEVLAVQFSNRVITVSQDSADRLKSRFPGRAAKIIHIPNGMTNEQTATDPAPLLEALDLVPGEFVISVGRLVPEKAQDLLIEAFLASRLARGEQAWKLLIVGEADHDSAYARKLRDMASRDERVVLAGRLSREDVLALNTAAGLFVLPSYHEGLSIAALEALRAHVPILMSDIKPNLNIGLPPHHYFQSGSADALTEKLDADLTTYAVGDGFDLSRFDWSEIARSTLREIDPLAGGDALKVAPKGAQDQHSGL